ncbi:MAG: hypothetical protein IT539_01455 [Bradyrhizobiaceae bacterium]|nr:hypothetical protein [Bradyrhizobiaceae bacterium]
MSFSIDGFLSPAMGQLRTSLRSVAEYKAWFDFAEDLNRVGLDMLRDRDVPRYDNQRLTISILFIRAHKSFQSSLLLAERGLVSDARVVLRSAIEGAIALNALANDPTFLDRIIEAHYYNQRKIARLILNDPAYRASHSPQQIAEMEATIRDVDAREKTVAPRKFKDPNWSEIAETHCKDLYQTLYRLLSGDGTHTTLNAIHRHVEYDANNEIRELKIGPDTTGLVETLKAACLMFLWAADPFARAFDLREHTDRLQEHLQRFTKLPQDEPASVAVVGRFSENVAGK